MVQLTPFSPMLNCMSPAAAGSQSINQASALSVNPPMASKPRGQVSYSPHNPSIQPFQCHARNEFIGPNNTVSPAVGLYPGLTPISIPTLEPQPFDGNPANYYSFIDTFDALISFNVP